MPGSKTEVVAPHILCGSINKEGRKPLSGVFMSKRKFHLWSTEGGRARAFATLKSAIKQAQKLSRDFRYPYVWEKLMVYHSHTGYVAVIYSPERWFYDACWEMEV